MDRSDYQTLYSNVQKILELINKDESVHSNEVENYLSEIEEIIFDSEESELNQAYQKVYSAIYSAKGHLTDCYPEFEELRNVLTNYS